MMKRLHGGILSLLACLMVSASGCMIGPNNNDTMAWAGDKISPAGFVLNGATLIEVQAYNWGQRRWETVATTRSTNGSWAYEGYDWHYWQASNVQLSREYWEFEDFWGELDLEDNGLAIVEAKLRALGDGAVLYTFDDWRLGSMRDMAAKVNGTEIKLRSLLDASY